MRGPSLQAPANASLTDCHHTASNETNLFFASSQNETDTSMKALRALQHEHRESLVGRYADSPYVIGQIISFNLSGIARSCEGSTPLRHSLNFPMLILGRTMEV